MRLALTLMAVGCGPAAVAPVAPADGRCPETFARGEPLDTGTSAEPTWEAESSGRGPAWTFQVSLRAPRPELGVTAQLLTAGGDLLPSDLSMQFFALADWDPAACTGWIEPRYPFGAGEWDAACGLDGEPAVLRLGLVDLSDDSDPQVLDLDGVIEEGPYYALYYCPRPAPEPAGTFASAP